MTQDRTPAAARAQAMLLEALLAVRAGDFGARLPADWTGLDGKIADTFNEIMATHAQLARAITRVSGVVGEEGRLGQRLTLERGGGTWGDEVDAINAMIDRLVQPVRDVGRVIGAVARGDLTESIQLEPDGRPLRGEFLNNARTINIMLDQLNRFSSSTATKRRAGSAPIRAWPACR